MHYCLIACWQFSIRFQILRSLWKAPLHPDIQSVNFRSGIYRNFRSGTNLCLHYSHSFLLPWRRRMEWLLIIALSLKSELSIIMMFLLFLLFVACLRHWNWKKNLFPIFIFRHRLKHTNSQKKTALGLWKKWLNNKNSFQFFCQSTDFFFLLHIFLIPAMKWVEGTVVEVADEAAP